MVCPNCHSHEIISVQGQNFCISCGQIVPDTESEKILAAVGAQLQPAGAALISGPPAPAQAPVPGAKPEKPAKKRGPGRPRKARMDAPITHLPPPTPAEPPAEPGPPQPKTAPVLPESPRIAPKPRAMTDVRRTPPAKPAEEPKPVETARLRHAHRTPGMQGAAWKGLSHALNFVQALPFGLAALLPAGIIWANLSQLAGLTRPLRTSDWWLLTQLALAGLAAVTVGLVAISAVIFGAARRQDQRGGSGLVWARAGAAACLRLWGVVLCQFILALPIAASVAALIRYGGLDLALPSQVSLGAVFLMAIVAGYLLAGAWIAGLLAVAGVTLGNLTLWQALHLGWNGWRRHPELLVNWLLVKLPTVILAAAWTWTLLPIDAASLASPAWLAQAASGLVLVLLVLTVQSGSAAEAAYRHVVTADRFGQAGSFLMGRSPKQLPRLALTPLVLTLLTAGGVAAIQLAILR